jgi:hypothetical protein
MWWLALCLMAGSAVAAAFVSSHKPLSLRARIAWIAACGFIGPPALASLGLIYPQREYVDMPLAVPSLA